MGSYAPLKDKTTLDSEAVVIAECSFSSLALDEEDADGTVVAVKDYPTLQNALPKSQRKTALIALTCVALTVAVIWVSPCRSTSEQEGMMDTVLPESKLSACDIASQLFVEYDAASLDKCLGLDVNFVSHVIPSLSASGTQLAVSTPLWTNHVRFIEYLGSPAQTSQDFVLQLQDTITHMALSGDGAYLVASGERKTTMVWIQQGERVDFSDIVGDANNTGLTVSDVVVNQDGTRFAVAYGSKTKSQATFDMGDERGHWEWDNYTIAEAAVFDRKAFNDSPYDWETEQFPMSYQTDNFGLTMAMNDDGSRIFQSTEHDNQQHFSNHVSKSKSMDAWYGTVDGFMLLSNDMCTDTISDVAVSGDGTRLVVALQCLNDSGVTLYLYRFVDETRTDDTFPVWNKSLEPEVRKLETDSLHPMLVTMSRDATVTVVAIEGLLAERFEGDLWSDQSMIDFASIEVPAKTKLSVEISEDASVVIFAASNSAGASVCLLTI